MSALGGRNCGAEVLISRWSERIGRIEQSARNGENKREAKQGCLPEVKTNPFLAKQAYLK